MFSYLISLTFPNLIRGDMLLSTKYVKPLDAAAKECEHNSFNQTFNLRSK
jgi:hypothetical protein